MEVDVLPETDPITATIPEFRRLSGIGRSRIYELLDAGEIESVYIGSRRLILIDTYRRLIERQRVPSSDALSAPVSSTSELDATARADLRKPAPNNRTSAAS
jgi:hypothetical protein